MEAFGALAEGYGPLAEGSDTLAEGYSLLPEHICFLSKQSCLEEEGENAPPEQNLLRKEGRRLAGEVKSAPREGYSLHEER